MQATTRDIINLIDIEASFELAEKWDNSGLQAGDLNGSVEKILIALDPGPDVIAKAVKINADLVLTHHPLLIKPCKCIEFNSMPGAAIAIAAKENISIVSAHTNLDKATNGLNDYFAEKIGLDNIKPLYNLQDQSDQNNFIDSKLNCFGRIGTIDHAESLKNFACKIKKILNLKYLRVIGDQSLNVRKVAVVTGSGSSFIEDFFKSGADLFITGDVKYHGARMVEERKLSMIDVGHFGSEYIAIELLFEKLLTALENKGYNCKVVKYNNEKDPFNIF